MFSFDCRQRVHQTVLLKLIDVPLFRRNLLLRYLMALYIVPSISSSDTTPTAMLIESPDDLCTNKSVGVVPILNCTFASGSLVTSTPLMSHLYLLIKNLSIPD